MQIQAITEITEDSIRRGLEKTRDAAGYKTGLVPLIALALLIILPKIDDLKNLYGGVLLSLLVLCFIALFFLRRASFKKRDNAEILNHPLKGKTLEYTFSDEDFEVKYSGQTERLLYDNITWASRDEEGIILFFKQHVIWLGRDKFLSASGCDDLFEKLKEELSRRT
jgi:hypothetical protein